MKFDSEKIILLSVILIILYLASKKIFEKRILEVTSKIDNSHIKYPNYSVCGLAPELMFPPKAGLRWCIDPVSGLEFPFSSAPNDAKIIALSDSGDIQRSRSLNA